MTCQAEWFEQPTYRTLPCGHEVVERAKRLVHGTNKSGSCDM